MVLIGLTGGAASGKSTVSRLLAARGAVVIDADRIGHEVIAPGGPAHEGVVARFGREVLAADGTVDRARLAAIVFSDPAARRDLEGLAHPAIYAEIRRRLEDLRGEKGIVVLDAPLLVETLPDRGRAMGMQALVVVAAGVEDQVERMVTGRGMSLEQARSRIAAQAPAERKLAAADYILDNRGDPRDLERAVDRLWRDLTERFLAG